MHRSSIELAASAKLRGKLACLGALGGVVAAAVLAGMVAAPAASAAACPPPPSLEHPFKQWGDSNSYVLTTGGSFEQSSSNWSLSGGARIVEGNEPWYVNSASDHQALYLPAGASALSGCTTAPLIDSMVRFFANNVGSASGGIHVEIVVNGGKNGVLDGGVVSPSTGWAPTSQIDVPWAHPLKGAVQLQLRLTAVGTGAAFDVDDAYIDPMKNQ
jgi:hypothetical protein